MPERVANEVTKAAWVATVTIPKPFAPNDLVNKIWAPKVATAAIAIPATFCEVPERMVA
jgi:hypothetical protein